MKIKIFIATTLFCAFAFSTPSYGASSTIDKIQWVRVTGANDLILILVGSNNGCGGKNILIPANAVSRDTIASIALTAFAAEKDFAVSYITCSNSPWANTATASDAGVGR